jgi:hypothetical protein
LAQTTIKGRLREPEDRVGSNPKDTKASGSAFGTTRIYPRYPRHSGQLPIYLGYRG